MNDVRIMAINIADLFDNFLTDNGIRIPCYYPEEEAEREKGNEAAMYGLCYWNLVEDIESMLMGVYE